MRVLVADHEPHIAGVLAEVLTGAGHDVATASDRPSALRRLAEHRYDVVVSDLDLPGGGGRALYEALQAAPPRFIFLLATTVIDGRTSAFLDRAGAATIVKPFSLARVRAAVEAVAAG